MPPPRLLLVTGKLAEPALRRIADSLAASSAFSVAVEVLPITVAALATTEWIGRHLRLPPEIDRVILPGLCRGDLDALRHKLAVPVERGPEDLGDLPEYLGQGKRPPADLSAHTLEILAEINHAPRLPIDQLLAMAHKARADGADLIDLGCDPGSTWEAVGDVVRLLRGEGFRVSVDSFNPTEVDRACRAGAELVLSVNSSNRAAAAAWGAEVVVVPDVPATLEGFDATIDFLARAGVPFRLDPILEPIGFGFSASLGRYLDVRASYPEAKMLMGVGNLTELTEVDSAGVNALLAGFCQEQRIDSVLTTEVANWCQGSVRELAIARRMMHHACTAGVPPKRFGLGLCALRDTRLRRHGEPFLRELSAQIKDRNIRVFAEAGQIYVLSSGLFLEGVDPFDLFAELEKRVELDGSHAFYLGYELAKAATALALGKNYVQDQALAWGPWTVPERSHRHPESNA